jgi:hypothetical protein
MGHLGAKQDISKKQKFKKVKLSTLLYTDYFKLPKEARKYQNKTLN